MYRCTAILRERVALECGEQAMQHLHLDVRDMYAVHQEQDSAGSDNAR